MIVDFRLNGANQGTTLCNSATPGLIIKVKGQRELEKVEVLRNSRVIKEFNISGEVLEFERAYADQNYQDEKEVLYYYIRVTQKNKEIAWSSPIWVEQA